MSVISTPAKNGVYRIAVYSSTSAPTHYLTLDPKKYIILDRLNIASATQQWTVTLGTIANTFTVTNKSNSANLDYDRDGSYDDSGNGYLQCTTGAEKKIWKAADSGSGYSKITLYSPANESIGDMVFDSQYPTNIVHFADPSNDEVNQQYAFEEVKPVDPAANANTDFTKAFFTMTIEEAQAAGPYDVIIVGSGFGGGVLASDLFRTNSKIGDAAQSILLIERGGLVFHSHCLNASRPGGLGKDRGQQNDTFFAMFKDDYDIDTSGGASGIDIPQNIWKGGPMYMVGGRSSAWGLFAPRIHDTTFTRYFPPDLAKELTSMWYLKAERLLKLSVPETQIVHQQLMERLDMKADPAHEVQWQWGRIASEFRGGQNFDFAEGAYSTIDKLLEIMMSKPVDADGKLVEHKNFKMLLNSEVRALSMEGKDARGVLVRPPGASSDVEILLKRQGNQADGPITGRVVLCAGSVASPSILLRSGVALGKGGGHITDHDILYKAISYRYTKPDARRNLGSMKLQTYFALGDGQMGLANISLDASSFLPRGEVADTNLPNFIISFIIPAQLEQTNSVTLTDKGEPHVKMVRTQTITVNERRVYTDRMRDLTETARNVIKEHLNVEWVPHQEKTDPYLSYLELGGVAHELGTLPMPDRDNSPHCVDIDLKLEGSNNIFVCDLSVFPCSPEVNPTLTLAALAIRLSRRLVPRDGMTAQDDDTIRMVNHSGEPIRVWCSNRAQVDVSQEKDSCVIQPGRDFAWRRTKGIQEAIFVFRLDKRPAKSLDWSDTSKLSFVDVPELHVGFPGEVVTIQEAFT